MEQELTENKIVDHVLTMLLCSSGGCSVFDIDTIEYVYDNRHDIYLKDGRKFALRIEEVED